MEVQCPQCQLRYRAPDAMAGRSVRCKQCSAVFEISAPGASAPLPTAEGGPLNNAGPGNPLSQLATARQPRDPSKLNNDTRETLDSSTDESDPPVDPIAKVAEGRLPAALIGVGLLWTTIETLRHAGTEPASAPWLQMLVFLASYLLIVAPLSFIGVRRAAITCGFELPLHSLRRILGTFALPFALACVLWLVRSSISGFIIGCFVGALLSCPILWLLFRLRGCEGKVVAHGAGWFLASSILTLLIVLGANLLLVKILQASGTDLALARSPLGPGLTWYSPPAVYQPPVTALAKVNPPPMPPPATAPGRTPPLSTAAQPSKSISIVAARSQTTQPAPPPDPLGLNVPEVSTRPAPVEGDPAFFSSVDPEPAHATAKRSTPGMTKTPGKTPDPPANIEEFVRSVRAANLPFVASIDAPAEPAKFDVLVCPSVPAPFIAVVRRGAAGASRDGDEKVECFSTDTLAQVGSATFPSDPDPITSRYALSPDGDTLLRISRLPKPSIQVWSLKRDENVARIDLNKNYLKPAIVGFIAPDRFVISFNASDKNFALETWDLKLKRALGKPLLLPPFNPLPANGQLSPDGKFFAVALRDRDENVVALYDLSGATQPRRFRIPDLDREWAPDPSGIAFSADAARMSVLIEHQGDGLIDTWSLEGPAKLPAQKIVPFGLIPRLRPGTSGGRVLDWIGNTAWLVHGDGIIDSETGRVLGRLGASSVVSQSSPDGKKWYLAYADSGGPVLRLAVLQIDPEKLKLSRR